MNVLLEKVKSIPHLPLPFNFDYKRMEEEIRAMPYPLIHYTANIQTNYKHKMDGWNNLALYSYDGSIFCDVMEGDGGPELTERWGKFQKTGLSEYLPYTYEILHKLGGGKSMARIEEVLPNTLIGWHSHGFEFHQPENVLIVQLPICVPEGFKYSVVNYKEYRSLDFSKYILIPNESAYTPGVPTVFNTYHYHNVFNNSKEPALMVRFFVDLNDPETQILIKSAIDQYTGLEYV